MTFSSHSLARAWQRPGISVLEQGRVRLVAALDLLDRLVVLYWDLAFDVNLLFFDQARGFACLFGERRTPFPWRRC